MNGKIFTCRLYFILLLVVALSSSTITGCGNGGEEGPPEPLPGASPPEEMKPGAITEPGYSLEVGAVYAADPEHVWASGEKRLGGEEGHVGSGKVSGVIYFSKGNGWTVQFEVEGESFSEIEAVDATHVWALGNRGVYHYDGTSWSKHEMGVEDTIKDISTVTSGGLWALGEAGVYFFDGKTWRRRSENDGFLHIDALDANRLWAIREKEACLFDGRSWKAWTLADGSYGDYFQLHDIFALDSTRVYASGIGQECGRLFLFGGGKWRDVSQDLPCRSGLVVSMSAVDNERIWASRGFDYGGTVLYHDGARWKKSFHYDDVEPQSIEFLGEIYAWDTEHVWAAAANKIFFFDGSVWHVQWLEEGRKDAVSYVDISASGPEDVWIVGQFGRALHYGSDGWREENVDTAKSFYDVDACEGGCAWAVGTLGAAFFWDGSRWQDRSLNADQDLVCVAAVDRDRAWAVGERREIFFYDGRKWELQWRENENLFEMEGLYLKMRASICAKGLKSAWAFINPSALFFDGSSWKKVGIREDCLPEEIHGLDERRAWSFNGFEALIFDGSSWSSLGTVGEEGELSERAGRILAEAGLSFAWGLSDKGIYHFDGSKWSLQMSSDKLTAETHLISLTWVDEVHAWALYSNGDVLFCDGSIWTKQETAAIRR